MILGQSGAELAYTLGFVPVGGGSQWQLKPAGVGAVATNVTVTNSWTVDFSTATLFQYTLTTAQTWFPLFANQTNGQTVRLVINQPASAAPTYVSWPAGITFVGGTQYLSANTGGSDIFDVTCVSQSTFLSSKEQATAPFQVAGAVTVTNSWNIDFSQDSIFQYTLTTAQTWFPLFVNQTNGQTVRIITKQPAGATWTYVVWPAGITFVGGTKVLSSVTGGTDMFDVCCVSQSTFIGNALQYAH